MAAMCRKRVRAGGMRAPAAIELVTKWLEIYAIDNLCDDHCKNQDLDLNAAFTESSHRMEQITATC